MLNANFCGVFIRTKKGLAWARGHLSLNQHPGDSSQCQQPREQPQNRASNRYLPRTLFQQLKDF